jgi:hypothetical protein
MNSNDLNNAYLYETQRRMDEMAEAPRKNQTFVGASGVFCKTLSLKRKDLF